MAIASKRTPAAPGGRERTARPIPPDARVRDAESSATSQQPPQPEMLPYQHSSTPQPMQTSRPSRDLQTIDSALVPKLQVARHAFRREMDIVTRSVSEGRSRWQPVPSLTLRVTLASPASASGATSKLALRAWYAHQSGAVQLYCSRSGVAEMVRWPSEAVGTGWRSTASEGHRTKPRILTGCGIARAAFVPVNSIGTASRLTSNRKESASHGPQV